MAKDYKTYEYFVHGLKNWNEFLAKPAGFEHFYGVSIKFERLAKAVFADTDNDSVVLIKNVLDTILSDFYISLNLKRDGSLFFSTNIDKDRYYNEVVTSYYYDELERLYDTGEFVYSKIDALILYRYFKPINIYFNYATKINNVMEIDNPEMSDLFDIMWDLRRLKKTKFLTYSKVKNTLDYKIKFKQSGNEYQLQYFTASMARDFDIEDFFKAKLDSYFNEFDGNGVLMVEAVLLDLYNEAKLIHTEILPEIESAKKQIYDFYEASQSSIKAKLEKSFNAYISDTQNPASYIMTYKNDTWQVVDRASYDEIMADKYNGPIYAKYDRLTNQLIKLHLPEVPFYKVVDYYIGK